MRWSLSWNPDGRSESFTREVILAAAPTTSGVYGLFNFDCQLFIGAAANIRDALLRHESETDFQSAHLRPTGFTFEPCAAELRAVKAAELIAKFRPLLQSEAILTEASAQSNSPFMNNVPVDSGLFETDSTSQEFPVDDREEYPRVRPSFNWKRAIPAVFFAAGVVAIFYLGLLTNKNIQEQASGASANIPARSPFAQSPESVASIASRPQSTTLIAASAPAKPEPDAIASTSVPDHKWSVQISAVPAKDAADALTQRLKDSGYDSYVIKAEVKGQSYYRVRVGRFDSQADAESVRQSLAHEEGYRDAFLAGD
jgi:cell division septation protein DedD